MLWSSQSLSQCISRAISANSWNTWIRRSNVISLQGSPELFKISDGEMLMTVRLFQGVIYDNSWVGSWNGSRFKCNKNLFLWNLFSFTTSSISSMNSSISCSPTLVFFNNTTSSHFTKNQLKISSPSHDYKKSLYPLSFSKPTSIITLRMKMLFCFEISLLIWERVEIGFQKAH